jgi:hypothetical protein
MRIPLRRYILPIALLAGASPLAMARPAWAGFTCSLSINDITVDEGTSGTTNAVFTVTRTSSGPDETFRYATKDGTATTPEDYQATASFATIRSTDTSTTILIPVKGDTIPEPDETFFVDLSSPSNCSISKNRGTATIHDPYVAPAGKPTGYRMAGADGGVFAYGQSTYQGSANTVPAKFPIVDIEETKDRAGYWETASDGGVFAYKAPYFGSMGGQKLQAPIMAMAPTPANDGYWMVGFDGGVFAFGKAKFFGSMGGMKLNSAIAGIVPTPTGQGYWLFALDGGVFSFGDAAYFGSAAGRPLTVATSGMAPTTSGKGYWLTTTDGQVMPFGDAGNFGQVQNPKDLKGDVVDIKATEDGKGYWLAAKDGGVFAFGSASFYGSAGGLKLNSPVVAMAGLR